MTAFLMLAVGAVLGALIGAIGHSAVVEWRHDCMPHDPDICREEQPDAR